VVAPIPFGATHVYHRLLSSLGVIKVNDVLSIGAVGPRDRLYVPLAAL